LIASTWPGSHTGEGQLAVMGEVGVAGASSGKEKKKGGGPPDPEGVNRVFRIH